MKHKTALAGVMMGALIIAGYILATTSHAKADVPSSFSLVATPSPIVATITPGQTTNLQIKILNNGNGTENLQIQPRSFSDSNNGQISLSDSPPPGITNWISFSAPKFTIAVGQWFTEQVHLAVPKDAGFSYSFILLINRQVNVAPPSAGQLIKGSLAVFTLLNVNRPGATRQLAAAKFTVSKHIYQWLPATFTVAFKNTGNTIVQPTGNIFVQRSATSKSPTDTLVVNSNGGYILPGTTRSFTSSWSDGFPVYQTVTNSSGATSQHLTWNWSKLSSFRFGRYTAELVAVYNNGTQDVPIQGEVSFWVIPWEILGVIIVVGLLILFGLFSLIRLLVRSYKRHTGHRRQKGRKA